MRAVVFAALARRDLERAWDYVAKENVRAADHLCDQIEQAVEIIARRCRAAGISGLTSETSDIDSGR